LINRMSATAPEGVPPGESMPKFLKISLPAVPQGGLEAGSLVPP
jgi:hypothetical protein